MKGELNIFFNAVLYYTRISVPKSVDCNNENLAKAYRYFPLIGYLVGAIAACIFTSAAYFLPQGIAIVLAMIAMILCTGALHEDGLADFCDGFGASPNKVEVLRIMKDSHIGTYGVIALILSFLIKFQAMNSLDISSVALAFLLAQGASRLAPMLLIYTLPYARLENSKIPQATLGISKFSLVVIIITALVPIFFYDYRLAIIYTIANILLFLGLRMIIKKRIGGFTGDTAGAVQQLSEILFYVIAASTY